MLSDRWLTFRELMAYLKIGRSKLYKLLQEGTIPASRIGKSWRIDREEVDAWISRGALAAFAAIAASSRCVAFTLQLT